MSIDFMVILKHLCLPLAPGMQLELMRSWSSKQRLQKNRSH